MYVYCTEIKHFLKLGPFTHIAFLIHVFSPQDSWYLGVFIITEILMSSGQLFVFSKGPETCTCI